MFGYTLILVTSDPIVRYLSQRSAKIDRRTRLRAMTNNEIIDTALRIYQQLGWTFLKLTAVPSLFSLGALAFITTYVLPKAFLTDNPADKGAQIGELMTTLALGLCLGGPLFLLGLSHAMALVTQLVADHMVGNVPSPDAARESARRTFWPLFKLNLRTTLMASSGLLISLGLFIGSAVLADNTDAESLWAGLVALLAIGGILVGGVFMALVIGWDAIAGPVAVVERLKGREASRRSRKLLKGAPYIMSGYGAIVTVYIVLAFVSAAMVAGLYGSLSVINYEGQAQAFASGLPFGPLLLNAVELLPLYLFVWTMIPAWAVIVTVIYFERRVRVEGYDIEALAGDVWRSDPQNRFEF
jgi:hypothetical protein